MISRDPKLFCDSRTSQKIQTHFYDLPLSEALLVWSVFSKHAAIQTEQCVETIHLEA